MHINIILLTPLFLKTHNQYWNCRFISNLRANYDANKRYCNFSSKVNIRYALLLFLSLADFTSEKRMSGL